jgi:4-amino-4-deoxy-L-arabinose transferase-like glycosyltransferase
LIVALVAAVPRLAVLLHERNDILTSFTEKSDDLARVFIHSGTFGFIPGEPTAWTQPLYAWFLIPIYWIFGRSWWAVGLIQIGVAVATALLIYESGAGSSRARAG